MMASADWFERLTGFGEGDGYAATQRRLGVEGDELVSTVNGKRYGIGSLSLPRLAELRSRVQPAGRQRSTVRCLAADVQRLHSESEFAGALFQVASQFNLLEMVGPGVTPEDGVARYASDHTQGPACAIAAGAATIYRNYLVPVGDGVGQRRDRQLDALEHLGAALSRELDRPVTELWEMHNGYALCTAEGLAAITELLSTADDELRDRLRGRLAIGLHRDVEVTYPNTANGQRVSQAFCSALPVSYSQVGPSAAWAAFARLVLEAAYEATLLCAVEQATAGGSNTVLLTRVGGSAFGNDDAWIDAAIVRALSIVEQAGLDVRLVSYGAVYPAMQKVADGWG